VRLLHALVVRVLLLGNHGTSVRAKAKDDPRREGWCEMTDTPRRTECDKYVQADVCFSACRLWSVY
jgi:hypothetical protein